ncbi:unnamed protein product (macronuclear) [Paramecium tetraurelia]|uniref:Uncharacterized protein n=1 Tax=Paramecium tetraurelia TaxID=5888 RepID=A0BJY5_PARTE|nr:uncharacterized protein GSPATT00029482001 [Paramecium tetraurelia]CAK58852.1 unnamed protein product [Paramecium tetraurelia]|eukprot:XP_001426250.1 hypothetical protein (macronuclear) [Paramecium tetraurelia strain d4-2]
MKNISNLVQDESKINQLRVSAHRKHPSPQIQIYDKLKHSIQVECYNSYTIKLKSPTSCDKKLFEYKNQRDLELLVSLVIQPCLHLDNCIHEQLYEKNQQGKTFRQVCEFRVDWTKKIKKAERYFENSIPHKKVQQIQCQNNDQFKIIILEAINNKQGALKMMIDKSKKESQFIEYAKRFAIQQRQRMDYSESLLTQFEDVQNRKKYTHPPSFWSILDCSCNATVL